MSNKSRREGEEGSRRHYESLPPEGRLGDAPVEAEFYDKMSALGQAVDELFNGKAKGSARQVGFLLLVFPFGNVEGRVNYISNGADRKDVITLMKEMIARFEGQPELKGRA